MDITDNVTLPILSRFSRWAGWPQRVLSKPRMTRSLKWRSEPRRSGRRCANYRGESAKGRAAKWLSTHPRILILDEPTRGIDVGTKAAVHSLMSELAAQGIAILMISSELPEILGMSDRILVMHDGRVTGLFDRSEPPRKKS